MHHYTSVTWQTLGGSDRAHNVMRTDIPRLAVHYPYLLHQILAVSAFHLAYLQPESRHAYSAKAAQHQALGLAGLREALSDNLTERSNYALFAASSFLIPTTFASRLKNDDSPDPAAPLIAILDVFAILRGTIAIDMVAAEKRHRVPSDDFYDSAPVNLNDPFLLPSMRTRLHDLRSKIYASPQSEPDELTSIMDQGILCLLDCTETIPGPNLFSTPEQRILHFWPMIVGDSFMDLIRRRSPPALVVFSYYCVVLRLAEEDSWYLDGWTDALTGSVAALLQGSPWAADAEWSMERIRAGQEQKG